MPQALSYLTKTELLLTFTEEKNEVGRVYLLCLQPSPLRTTILRVDHILLLSSDAFTMNTETHLFGDPSDQKLVLYISR